MNFLPALHGLRGLAAVLVLLFHWRTNFPAAGNALSKIEWLGQPWNLMLLIDNGWIGVQWFFVLSGYLLGGVLWNRPLGVERVVHFWQRRFARIYPGLWFQLLLLALFTSYTLLLHNLDPERMRNNLLLWLHPLPGGSVPYNGVWWTLPIELCFYLVLPLCLVFYRRMGVWTTLIAAFAISIAWRYAVMQGRADPAHFADLGLIRHLPGSLCLFMAGMVLNHWPHAAGWRHTHRVLFAVTALYLLWLYLLHLEPRGLVNGSWATYVWEPVAGLLIAGIVWLVVHPDQPMRWLGSRPLLLLGTWSYGIYLWHFPVLRLLPRVVPGPWKTVDGSWLALLICVVATLALAALSYHAVERPVLNAVARWQNRHRPTP